MAVLPIIVHAQNSYKTDSLINFPCKLFTAHDKRTSSIEGKLDRQTSKYLTRLERREQKLKKKVWKKDSLLANQLFDGTNGKYIDAMATRENLRMKI